MDRPTPLARALRAVLRISITFTVVAGAVLAVILAREVLASQRAEAAGPPAAPRTAVATGRIEMREAYAVTRRFAGEFEPPQTTMLGFELGGSVAAVLVEEGDPVAEGQPLARLDTRLLSAERDRLVAARRGLAAQAELARRTNVRQAELRRRGFASDQALDDSSLTLSRLEAGIAEADAGIDGIDVRLTKAEIVAPYAGRIGARLMDAGAVAAPGAPVVALLEDGPALFEVGLDPDLAARLTAQTRMVVEADDAPHAARLVRLSPQLDPATRTRTAFLAVAGGALPPAGSTGEVVLVQEVPGVGAWVPVSALRPGPGGSWQLLTVAGAPPRIAVEAAEIVHAAGERAYVRGTFPAGAAYVTEGAHRVVPGETVRLLDAAPGEADR